MPVVSLYIDETSLRLMVTEGKEIKEWAELPLEPGLVKNNVVVKEAEVTAKIQQLFKDRKVTTRKVTVGVSGLRCLTRPIVLPQLPKEMQAEAVKREAKRVLPVPPEQLYVSWQVIPAPEGKTQVFLVALPRTMADPLLKVLRQAGVKPSFMDLKPLLLARVVKEAVAVIVDVQAAEFDIVIVAGGIPQPVRTVQFATEAPSWEEKLTTIKNELNRTITFYNTNNPDNVLAATVPIFASGELADQPELCQTLSRELGHPVPPLPPPLESPDGFTPSRYMANMGLVMQQFLSGKETGPSVVNLNVLPVAYQVKPISLTRMLALPSGAIAVGLLAFLVMLSQGAPAEIESIRNQVSTAEKVLKQRQLQRQVLTDNVTKMEAEVTKIEASLRSFTAALGSLEKQGVAITDDLKAAVKDRLEYGVKLKSISRVSNALNVSGQAPGEKEVLAYFKGLEASGQFSEVVLTSMSRAKTKGTDNVTTLETEAPMDFTIQAKLGKPTTTATSLELVVKRLPAATILTSVTYGADTLTVVGTAPDEGVVLSYLWDLLSSGKFTEIDISSIKTVAGKGTEFSVVLKVAR